MEDTNPSIMSHVSVGVASLESAAAFYDSVMVTLGARRIHDESFGIGYGKLFPEFWIGQPHDGAAPTPGNGTHFAFLAASRTAVDAFHAAALAAGGSDEGAPGPRPHYGEGYYCAFIRDPDGNKIEAMILEEPSAA